MVMMSEKLCEGNFNSLNLVIVNMIGEHESDALAAACVDGKTDGVSCRHACDQELALCRMPSDGSFWN